MNNVAIIGGGVTGLAAAFQLQQQGIPVTLFEAADRAGGVIQSVKQNGYLAECGPNTILETSPKITALIQNLGLEHRRIYSDPAANKRFLVRGGHLVELPDSAAAFAKSRLFSVRAKLRLIAEPFIGAAPQDTEESVTQFVVRRLGHEFLDYAINPLVGGVYAGDPARLSVKHAFPKLHALEQKYHSLIRGQILGARERKRRAEVSKQNANKLSFDDGLQVLTDELCSWLGDSVKLGATVQYIRYQGDSWQVKSRVDGEDQVSEHGAILFAGTAHKLAQLQVIADGAPDLSRMSQVYYPPVASIVLGFRREDVTHPLDGFGVLVPEVEHFQILGAIFSSSLFPNRAPAGHVLLTCYLGGARNPTAALLEPEAQLDLVLRDLRQLLGVKELPTFRHQFVFQKAIPQYEVGYGKFKQLMDQTEAKCPGFFLGGHYRDGISLGDSIVSGFESAARIQKYLTRRPIVDQSQLRTAA